MAIFNSYVKLPEVTSTTWRMQYFSENVTQRGRYQEGYVKYVRNMYMSLAPCPTPRFFESLKIAKDHASECQDCNGHIPQFQVP